MDKPEFRVMLGNEAIARGLIEAGVQFISAYPGTPSSEILPAVVRYKEELGLNTYAEWSTNEKVALETALAAAYSGKRAAVAMKQVGLNVAADPALSAAYIGVVGGLVLIVADDPGPHSSQTEQDTRLFGLFSKLPVLDPSTPEEAKELAALAFELSERHQIPIILRPTVRVCHARANVACGPVTSTPREAAFVKNPRRWAATPKARLALHGLLNQKLAAIEKEFETWEQNRAVYPAAEGKAPLGIIACGVSHAHVSDLLAPLGLEGKVAVLKIATAYPLPRALVEGFTARCENVLILEEPDIAVETQVRVPTPVWGRITGHVPSQGELTPEVVADLLTHAALEAGLSPRGRSLEGIRSAVEGLNLPIRRPTLCPGCGHRSAFYAIKRFFPDAIFPGDIGCYTLGLNLGSVDTVHDMGASITMASGFYHAYAQDGKTPPIIATIGDGTFFHSGAAGLENAVYNGARFVLLVLNNEITGMTGMQPTPEFGLTADGHPGRKIELEPLIRGCGVEFVEEADAFDLTAFQRTLARAVAYTRKPTGGVAVVVTRYACVTRIKGLGEGREPIKVEVKRGDVPRPQVGVAKLAPDYMPRHEDKLSPCVEACPAGNPVERLLALAGEGRLDEAAALLREGNPLPATLGRVCPHPCELNCNRAGFDEPLSIRAIERLVGDVSGVPETAPRAPSTGKKVAVVGAGPSGLAAAYNLARSGHTVELFEAEGEVGGMLRWAIPDYRLPVAVIRRESRLLMEAGVKVRTGVRVGTDLPWEALDGFDACYLAVGAWEETTLAIPGEEREGVLSGLQFLRSLKSGVKPDLGRRVAVIGGGNTAIDAARTARRLGAEVTLYYRREETKMRAIPEEVAAAKAEGIFLRFNVRPLSIEKGHVRPLSLKMNETRPANGHGFEKPFPGVEGSRDFSAEVDSIIVAVGAAPDPSHPRLGAETVADRWGRTSLPGFFAGGDGTTTGGGTVTAAVGAGRRAAVAINAWLADSNAPAHLNGDTRPTPVTLNEINLRHFAETPRVRVHNRPPEELIWTFDEAEGGLTPEGGLREAGGRCFHCGVCTMCDTCLKVCPTGAITLGPGGYEISEEKCTGCRLCKVECPRDAITMPETGVCVACGYCVTMCECPALVRDADGFVEIDRRICIDCGFCSQVCSQNAIRPVAG